MEERNYESIPKMYPDENFVMVNYNGIMVPRYAISDYGNLYDFERKAFIQFTEDKDGYFCTSIKINDGKYQRIRINRVELMSFNPTDDLRNQSNHKDGNKQNNRLYNLEWLTPIENTRHSWDTGLNQNIGINNGNGKYGDITIHNICAMIDWGYTNAQICDAFGIYEKDERMTFNATISGVRHGKSHRNISMNYNFGKGLNKSNRYPEFFAHLVCQFLSDPNRNYTYKEIMDLLNIPNDERANFKVFINDLVRGRTYKHLSEMYNLERPVMGDRPNEYLMRDEPSTTIESYIPGMIYLEELDKQSFIGCEASTVDPI